MGGPHGTPATKDHLFCTIQTANSQELWKDLGGGFYDYIVVDEAHHAPASSYKGIFEGFSPRILLGLTATPERMDGESILPYFGNRIAAELRLPEALDEKLLCPFQYFGVADPVSVEDDRFWQAGKYSPSALEHAYVDDAAQADARHSCGVTQDEVGKKAVVFDCLIISRILLWTAACECGRIRILSFCNWELTMRDMWYADKRDLIKWGVLLRLAEAFKAGQIIQLAFYRRDNFGKLLIDGLEQDIPEEVVAHFRNLQAIKSISTKVRINVFKPLFENRNSHLLAVLAYLAGFSGERCIVFLDPDTGLEPIKPNLNHVLDSEVNAIWGALKRGDVFALYQHQTNRSGQPWIDTKRAQLSLALGIKAERLKVASGADIANDVVIFYTQKPE